MSCFFSISVTKLNEENVFVIIPRLKIQIDNLSFLRRDENSAQEIDATNTISWTGQEVKSSILFPSYDQGN